MKHKILKLFSLLFFCDVNTQVRQMTMGSTKDPELLDSLRVLPALPDFNLKFSSRTDFFGSILRAVWRPALRSLALIVAMLLFFALGPLNIEWTIAFIGNLGEQLSTQTIAMACGAILLLAVTNLTAGMFLQHYIAAVVQLDIQIRHVLARQVVARVLTLCRADAKHKSPAEIVNLVSTDCGRVSIAFSAGIELAYAMIALALITVIGYGIAGISVFAGLLVVVLVVPVALLFSQRYSLISQERAKKNRSTLSAYFPVFKWYSHSQILSLAGSPQF